MKYLVYDNQKCHKMHTQNPTRREIHTALKSV